MKLTVGKGPKIFFESKNGYIGWITKSGKQSLCTCPFGSWFKHAQFWKDKGKIHCRHADEAMVRYERLKKKE